MKTTSSFFCIVTSTYSIFQHRRIDSQKFDFKAAGQFSPLANAGGARERGLIAKRWEAQKRHHVRDGEVLRIAKRVPRVATNDSIIIVRHVQR